MASNTQTKTPRLMTAREISTAVGSDVNRVKYILKDRLLVKPTQRFGPVYAYSPDVVPLVRDELKRIEARRRPVRITDTEVAKVG